MVILFYSFNPHKRQSVCGCVCIVHVAKASIGFNWSWWSGMLVHKCCSSIQHTAYLHWYVHTYAFSYLFTFSLICLYRYNHHSPGISYSKGMHIISKNMICFENQDSNLKMISTKRASYLYRCIVVANLKPEARIKNLHN